MKRFFIIIVVLTVFTGCDAAKWESKAEVPSLVKVGEQTTIKVTVLDHGQPVPGVEVKALLEMKRMDHGIEQVDLKEQGKGEYRGTMNLPMEGEWVANLELKKDGKKQEFEYNFIVEGKQK